MNIGILQPTHATSAYTYPDPSPFVNVEETNTFSLANKDAQGQTWDEFIDQLINIGILKDDWDGEGGVTPNRALVAGAIKLALALKAAKYPPAERVAASVNGTVYFEWHTPFGYQEIEITSPLDAEFRKVQEGAMETEIFSISLHS